MVIAEEKPNSDILEESPRIYFIQGDYTTLAVLDTARVAQAARAILLADKSVPNRTDQDRDARTILAGLMIEKLSPGIFTCAELLSRDNEEHLRMAGIEEVVATSTRIRGVTEIADDIFSAMYGNQIYKRKIPIEWAGLTFLEMQQRMKMTYDALLMGIERSDEHPSVTELNERATPYSRTITNPPAHYELLRGDQLIIVSKKEPKW